MKIKDLYPKFSVPVKFENLNTVSGQYWKKSDIIVLDSKLKRGFPAAARITLLHEIMHSTGSYKRLMRFQRLEDKFDIHTPDSVSWKMEECIVEIACMVACAKLGWLNKYTKEIIMHGIRENYRSNLTIPLREVRAAVRYYADDQTDFSKELKFIQRYLKLSYGVKFQEGYSK